MVKSPLVAPRVFQGSVCARLWLYAQNWNQDKKA